MKKQTSKIKFVLVFLIVALLFLIYFKKKIHDQIESAAQRLPQTETVQP
jgi:low temperature requirement protein LtrA